MKSFVRKFLSASASLMMLASAAVSFQKTNASAANTYWKFDFGGGGTASGYTGVSASDGYNASRGYGFSSGTNVSNVSAAGRDALSDAVQFKNSSSNGKYTFCADVPNGLYQVSVWLGNTGRTSVAIEGMYQIMNLTGNNAYHTLQVPVTDGQLNICACAGKENNAYTMSALEIRQISTQTHTNPTIWVCGDSTVCNYYPLDSSQQAGWAQMLGKYVDSSQWQIMNMATSGQYARGFIQGGQFNVIEKNGQPGDIYVISIGINDTNSKNNTTEAQYEEIITDMAQRAMKKGMRVILVKQQGRNGDCQRNPLLKTRWYGGALDRVGKKLNIEVVDLFNLWQNDCLKKSANEVSALYMSDGLHPNRAGATRLAELMY
nr:GDSL family lipase [Oscillospiraceae bacterium]